VAGVRDGARGADAAAGDEEQIEVWVAGFALMAAPAVHDKGAADEAPSCCGRAVAGVS